MPNNNKLISKKRSYKEEEDSNDEAVEEFIIDDNGSEANISEPNDGEDLDEKFDEDYKDIKELDEYDEREFDNEDYSDMELADKHEVDRLLNKRDKKLNKKGKKQKFLEDYSSESLSDSFKDEYEDKRNKKIKQLFGDGDANNNDFGVLDDNYQDEIDFFNMEDLRGKPDEWFNDLRTIGFIKRNFRRFIYSYKGEKGVYHIYLQKIDQLCSENKISIDIDYNDLSSFNSHLSYWIFEHPNKLLPIINKTIFEIILTKYPGYGDITDVVLAKFINFPIEDKLRDLRINHLNTMIKIRGVITKRYRIQNRLTRIYYTCNSCGDRKGPVFIEDVEVKKSTDKLGNCEVCSKRGPYTIDFESSVYGNHQKLVIQESPNAVEAGRIPRQKEVILLYDNIDFARPGDEVEILGVFQSKFDYKLNIKYGFPVFSTFIEANAIKRLNDIKIDNLLSTEKKMIIEYSKKPNIIDIITRSVAPSIHGHHHIKSAISLSMFGGESKVVDNHVIRGDINVLLLGDPGLAKSQFLKYIEKTFYRTVYTTGKGASAVGLTAAVTKDPNTNEWTLEGGALVLADKGICLIDEFDKMSETDRTSIHEAMEQQSISISKAGIVTSLKARCAVIAAANPIKGRYDNLINFGDNVNLSEPILSRFDILCVVKDTNDQTRDSELASFIINSHIKNHPDFDHFTENGVLREPYLLQEGSYEEDEDKLDNDLLKKYILFARNNIQTSLGNECKDKISKFYAELREESRNIGGINIVTRHLESIIRMAHAAAKMKLKRIVESDDVDFAISVLLESFIQSQRIATQKILRKKFSKYIRYGENYNSIMMEILGKIVNQQIELKKVFEDEKFETDNIRKMVKIDRKTLKSAASERNIVDIDKFLKSKVFLKNYILKQDEIIKYYN